MGDQVKVGVKGYEIQQGLDHAEMTLKLVFSNPRGEIESYGRFMHEFEDFLERSGYSLNQDGG